MRKYINLFEEPKGGKLYSEPASPDDKDNYKLQQPELDPDFTKRIGSEAHKKAQRLFTKNLMMLQSTYEMLKGFGQTDPDMEEKIKDLIDTGIKAGFIKGA